MPRFLAHRRPLARRIGEATMQCQRHVRHDHRCRTTQFDLFAAPSGEAVSTPAWNALPEETRSALIGLMAQLIHGPPRRRRNAEVRAREYLTDGEIARLITATGKSRYGHRDATMVLVAYRHGLRAGELVTLRWDAIDFAHGRLQESVQHIELARISQGDAAVRNLPPALVRSGSRAAHPGG